MKTSTPGPEGPKPGWPVAGRPGRGAASALERERILRVLRRREEFDRLVARVAARLNALGPEEIARALDEALDGLARFADVDRSYVFQFSDDLARADNTHEWCAPGVEAQRPGLQGVPTAAFPWWMERLRQGEAVRIDSVGDLPAEAAAERELLEGQGIRSALVLPLTVGDAPFGFLGFDLVRGQRSWPAESVELLTIGAGLMAGALARVRAQRERAASERRFRSIVQNGSELVTILSTDGLVGYQSPAALRLLGTAPEGFLGAPLGGLVHPDDAGGLQAALEGLAPGASAHVGYRLRHADGSWRWLEGDAVNLVEDPEVGGFVINARDVTELKRQREALQQTEKLAAMGRLLAGVAHELNNPLAVVTGQADLLEHALRGSPEEERARKIGKAAERCARIVKDFLALARQQPLRRGPVSLAQSVEEAIELLAYGFERDGIEVRLELAADLPSVSADGHQIQQVLINLLGNAQHALRGAPPPRRVGVTARPDDGGRVLIVVSDNGPGVPRELRPRIFEPFFTTKPEGQGTGLGLSLCKGMVEAHGGTLALEDGPGPGASFRILLPVAAAGGHGRPAATPPPRSPGAGPSRAVLVVDDEADVGEVVGELLRQEGHRVDVVTDGPAALARLAAAPYDLVLSGLRLPGMDGPTLHREAVRRWPALGGRFVFLTGGSPAPAGRDLFEQGRARQLAKPIEPARLRALVAESWGLDPAPEA